MYFQFANVLVFFLLAFVLCGLMLGLGLLLRPSNPHPGKLTTYECGEPPSGNAWINFNIRFYLIALVFVIFEVEIAFIVPVATVFRDWIARGQGAFALAEITLFVAILAVGLVYVWVKGDLEWLKRLPQYRGEPAAEPLRRDAA
ncbi:MAG: NADH-quinone oxidoreductase subunit A [Actinobacteria bacterium]|nr:MAG: NADH-quinone oxidoreductase subunit A [Actinomycetota bacterium]